MNASLTDSVRREYLTKLILTTVFLTAFVLYVLWMFVWRPGAASFTLSPFDLALLGFATFRLGRMVAWDRVAHGGKRMTDERERWAVILGASSGMGEATALALAAAGYRICGIHLD
ncbi:MAG TPA: hypothetical protein VF498_03575, partial [Anaerolineales bacterium]